ncbi:glycosyltransferase [Leptothoe sp. PORK10 BA2]|uniref:glycosyltransferase n=1 Tax=Leptothoe sp. PORK10 BA2 TaxID=3110254 RepID=UPI002B1EA385|nr:glycosyltransferase [Leptothoe sp. PORK10 BA2]MEA5466828.1 glycosyltransferase [Leptothoe sp. PORK10 BA2]
MKTKVCITSLEFPPDVGGVGESVSRIANMLIELGYDVHVAVFRAVFREETAMAAAGEFRRSTCHTTQQNGVTVHRLKPAVRSIQAKAQDYLCDLHSQLRTLHQTYKFDLLHAFFINEMGFVTTLLGHEIGLPVINSIRGADLNKHIFNPAQFSQVAWTLTHSTQTTFVSQDLMHRARIIAPEIENKSAAFWNSIMPIDFDELPEPALAHQLQGTVIGSVGSFRDKKGLEHLFDACQTLRKEKIAEQMTLLLVGDFAEKERNYWEQTLEQSGFADRVVITGKISRQEALAYLPYMDIFAIPSLRDGCPNAMLEAMLAAKAIVGSNVDAIGEIIEDGGDGLLVRPGDTENLTDALRWLMIQSDLRSQLGIAARQKALSQFAPAIEQQNWKRVYETALADHTFSVNQPSANQLSANQPLVNQPLVNQVPLVDVSQQVLSR